MRGEGGVPRFDSHDNYLRLSIGVGCVVVAGGGLGRGGSGCGGE